MSDTQAMATPSTYLALFADMPDAAALSAATTLQQQTYAKQLRAFEGCLARLRSSLYVGHATHSLRACMPLIHSVELDSCAQRVGRLVQECRRLFAGLSSTAQQVARPPVPSPSQLVDNLHTVWCEA